MICIKQLTVGRRYAETCLFASVEHHQTRCLGDETPVQHSIELNLYHVEVRLARYRKCPKLVINIQPIKQAAVAFRKGNNSVVRFD